MISASVDTIKKIAFDSAAQMGIHLSDVTLIDGCSVGITDANLIYFYADNGLTCSLIYLSDMEGNSPNDHFRSRVTAALSRLTQ